MFYGPIAQLGEQQSADIDLELSPTSGLARPAQLPSMRALRKIAKEVKQEVQNERLSSPLQVLLPHLRNGKGGKSGRCLLCCEKVAYLLISNSGNYATR